MMSAAKLEDKNESKYTHKINIKGINKFKRKVKFVSKTMKMFKTLREENETIV